MTQQQALAILKTGASVFLTGEPGSGKTHTVNLFVAWLKEHGIQPAVTASTGIAATHINGQTIHSWSGIGIKSKLGKSELKYIADNKKISGKICSTHTLIIDEISMLSAEAFGMVDTVCRFVRKNENPFGGLQVVLVGDFFQLPPVAEKEDKKNNEGELFIDYDEPQNIFAFSSPSWGELNPRVCYLSEQHRQEDPEFLDLLSAIRSQSVSMDHRSLLEGRLTNSVPEETTQFFSHNFAVDRVNHAKLKKLPGKTHTFKMEVHGAKNFSERLVRGCLSPEILELKIGARVMFTKNDIIRRKFVNGTLGVVAEFSKDGDYPIVTTDSGQTIYAEPTDWRIEDGESVLARITQVPLRLAWAITVHKSQGMSLDSAHMDLSMAFERGQGYVAISRVRNLSGLSLVGFNEIALEVNPDIVLEDLKFKESSALAQKEFSKISRDELERMENKFITDCGGSAGHKEKKNKNSVSEEEIKKKVSGRGKTLELISKYKNIDEVADSQGVKYETIISHLEELIKLDKLQRADLLYLINGKEVEITEILTAFNDLGIEYLKPTFERFEGKFDYKLLRLARLLFVKPK